MRDAATIDNLHNAPDCEVMSARGEVWAPTLARPPQCEGPSSLRLWQSHPDWNKWRENSKIHSVIPWTLPSGFNSIRMSISEAGMLKGWIEGADDRERDVSILTRPAFLCINASNNWNQNRLYLHQEHIETSFLVQISAYHIKDNYTRLLMCI